MFHKRNFILSFLGTLLIVPSSVVARMLSLYVGVRYLLSNLDVWNEINRK